MERAPFIVNLSDPGDLRAKLERAKQILSKEEAKLVDLRQIERNVDEWRGTVAFLASRVPPDEDSDSDGRTTSPSAGREVEPRNSSSLRGTNTGIGDLVIEVVNREFRAIQAKSVTSILQAEGHEVTPTMVSNALHYAARRAHKIAVAPGRGMYAPLSSERMTFVDSASGFGSTSSNREAVQR